MRILIVGGGSLPSKELLIEEFNKCNYSIAADKGGEYLFYLNLTPDLLIGDFDSIAPEVLSSFKRNGARLETYPREKDYTDSELCVNRAIVLGADEIIMLGFTGSRIDHLIGNIGLLNKCLLKGIRAYIIDDNNKIFLADKPLLIKGKIGSILSLQAYSHMVRGLTITGVKYPLDSYDLEAWSTYTVSNEVTEPEVSIEFTDGILMVIEAKD